jgi:hypothetical protein
MLLGLQHLTAILGALRSILGKAREFFVSMAVTDYAVLAMFAILFAKASYALVLAIFKLLVWIARCIIGFLFDLPHLVPLLFTAALPIFRLPVYQKLPDGLEDMLRKRPCTVSNSIPSNPSIILCTILFQQFFLRGLHVAIPELSSFTIYI